MPYKWVESTWKGQKLMQSYTAKRRAFPLQVISMLQDVIRIAPRLPPNFMSSSADALSKYPGWSPESIAMGVFAFESFIEVSSSLTASCIVLSLPDQSDAMSYCIRGRHPLLLSLLPNYALTVMSRGKLRTGDHFPLVLWPIAKSASMRVQARDLQIYSSHGSHQSIKVAPPGVFLCILVTIFYWGTGIVQTASQWLSAGRPKKVVHGCSLLCPQLAPAVPLLYIGACCGGTATRGD